MCDLTIYLSNLPLRTLKNQCEVEMQSNKWGLAGLSSAMLELSLKTFGFNNAHCVWFGQGGKTSFEASELEKVLPDSKPFRLYKESFTNFQDF